MARRYFSLPYDSGHRAVRMGNGPLRLVEALNVEATEIAPASEWRAEIRTTFELYRALAGAIKESGDVPVVFSGNCGSAIAVASALGTDDLALIWFDAHGDYNSPDTTDTGFLDGMGLRILTGGAWTKLARTIPGFAPLDPKRVVHCGARDWSPGEREALLEDEVRVARTADEATFDGIDATRILIHIDADVIDPRFGRANPYACDGGLSPDELLSVLERAKSRFEIAGLVVASYDPSCDPEGCIVEVVRRVVDAAV
jgi:arginase